MPIGFIPPKRLIQKETDDDLVLLQLNKLKIWGLLSLSLGVVSLAITLPFGFYLIGEELPGPVPQTFVDVIDQIVQRRLANLPTAEHLGQQSIRLRSHPTGRLEFIVNGTNYREIKDIPDHNVRDLIQAAVEDWQ